MPRGHYQRTPHQADEASQGAAVEGVSLSAQSVEGSGDSALNYQRPAKETTDAAAPTTKKGRRSWGNSNLLGVTNKDKNFAYKWVRKDAATIARHLDNGYEFCGNVVNEKAVNTPTERMYDGSNLTSNMEKHDTILMRLPNDLKAERDEWLDSKNAQSKSLIEREATKELKNSSGGISIQGGGYKNIIE